MKDIDAKLAGLLESLDVERKKLVGSSRRLLIVLALIIIAIACYTVYVSSRIQMLATPRNIAVALTTKIKDMLPQLRTQMVSQADQGAKQLAQKTIGAVQDLIPKGEVFAKAQLDQIVDNILDRFEKEQLGILQDIVKISFDKVTKNKDIIQDEKIAKALAVQISEDIDKELGRILNNSFYNSLDNFKKDIDTLKAKSPARMTLKDAAEKRLIIYWLFLVNHAQTGDSGWGNVLSSVTNNVENLFQKYQ